MKVFKKIMSTVVATATLFTGMAFPVSAIEDTKIGFATGALKVSKEDEEAFFEQYGCNITADSNMNVRSSTLPDYVDLSTSPFFPPIGDQGELESCVSWATTYYQFTYEAHKLNNIRTTANNAYSPAWTYNYTNGGENKGTKYINAYKVLIDQGALTMKDMPYYNTEASYDYGWSTNTDAMIEALNTRMTGYDSKRINSNITKTPITSNKDTDLNEIKNLLNSGKMPVIQVCDFANWDTKETNNNPQEIAAYRAWHYNSYTYNGHMLTVVGYDDRITCDFNNNGTIEASERGAFKIANSWGTNPEGMPHNNGYMWVMYDALNHISANTTNNWEANISTDKIRHCAFSDLQTKYDNYFYFINVENVEVGIIAKMHINTNYRNTLRVSLNRTTDPINSGGINIDLFDDMKMINYNKIIKHNGDLIMDFGNLDNPLSYLSSNYYYGAKITNMKNSAASSFTGLSLKLIDNMKNEIYNYSILNTLANGNDIIALNQFNLSKGDMNYDDIIDENDVNILIDYIVGLSKLSNLQSYIGDIDNNGEVALADLTALRKLVSSASAKAYISSFINSYNTQQLSTFKRISDSYEKK